MNSQWRLKFRLFTAKLMIKLGKLRHADYVVGDIQTIVDKHLPQDFFIDVPVGKGELNLIEAKVSMPKNQSSIHFDCFGSIIVKSKGSPIYRAHLSVTLAVYPKYDKVSSSLMIDKIITRNLRFINDEYAIIEDSRDLLSLLVPRPLQHLLSGTVKSAFGLMTGGVSEFAADYLKLYVSGSKQRVFDYHKPQIEALVQDFSQNNALQYSLDTTNFEEQLFALYGKTVVVEDGYLRFKF